MLAHERQNIIMQVLYEKETVKVSELCDMFDVSIETIRRDLDFLSDIGKLKRVYGGAVLVDKVSTEPTYEHRFIKNKEAKQKIGKETAKLVSSGDTLIIDLGTTTLEVAKHLKKKRNLTVITNSLYIAKELVDIKDNRIILIGGSVRAGELSTSGIWVDHFLKSFNVDKVIIGVGGITLKNGVSDYHLDEAKTRKLMIDRGNKIIAVADHSKFGVEALINICSVNQIDTIVTDNMLSDSIFKKYQKHDINIIRAN